MWYGSEDEWIIKSENLTERGKHSMTANNINFWGYKETQRHNLAMEDYYQGSLEESKRHNLATEANAAEQVKVAWANNQLGWKQLDETVRHNKANESLGWANVSLGWANVNELKRHNMASEANQLLSIKVQQSLGQQKQDLANKQFEWQQIWDPVKYKNDSYRTEAALTQAEASKKNADTNRYNMYWNWGKDVANWVTNVTGTALQAAALFV